MRHSRLRHVASRQPAPLTGGMPRYSASHGPVTLPASRATSPGGPAASAATVSAPEAEPNVVPFLVEDELMSLGATFSKVKNWGVHTVADGQLITGQNPASSGPAARLLIDALNRKTNGA